jgi:NADH-quinone oxidoreductase subunit M
MSFQLHNILIFLLVLPLVGILSIFFLPTWNDVLIKKIALFFSGLSVILSLFLLSFFNFSQSQFQFYLKFNWISNLNFNFILGIDGISLFFILLTNLLIFLCILLSWNFIKYNLKLYFSLFFF